MVLMEFKELSDRVHKALSPKSNVGRHRVDDRIVMNSILYVITGYRWICLLGMGITQQLLEGLDLKPKQVYADAAYDVDDIRNKLH